MSLTLEQLLDHGTGLASLPAIAVRLNQMVDDPDATVADIGRLISQDPGLTMRLLKIANGPFYGMSSHVDTISRAVMVLGTRQIRDLVLATSVSQTLDKFSNELMSMEDFWRHSLYVGLCARFLAEHGRRRDAESLFIAGLLHDIGRLLIFNREPDLAHAAFLLGLQRSDGLDPPSAERAVLGFDHAEVGQALAARWQLPEKLQMCIRYHHDPLAAPDYKVECAIVHIANSLAHMAEIDTRDERDVPPVEAATWEIIGVEKSLVPDIIEQAQLQVVEMESLILHAA